MLLVDCLGNVLTRPGYRCTKHTHIHTWVKCRKAVKHRDDFADLHEVTRLPVMLA
jgi:hypothetical protein